MYVLILDIVHTPYNPRTSCAQATLAATRYSAGMGVDEIGVAIKLIAPTNIFADYFTYSKAIPGFLIGYAPLDRQKGVLQPPAGKKLNVINPRIKLKIRQLSILS